MSAASEQTGVQGTPSKASAELGKIYLDLKIDNAVNQLRAFRAGK
jgi:creatinine amidohydrolase/Fe(II)-dependent formamide hydrolase-like protein